MTHILDLLQSSCSYLGKACAYLWNACPYLGNFIHETIISYRIWVGDNYVAPNSIMKGHNEQTKRFFLVIIIGFHNTPTMLKFKKLKFKST